MLTMKQVLQGLIHQLSPPLNYKSPWLENKVEFLGSMTEDMSGDVILSI